MYLCMMTRHSEVELLKAQILRPTDPSLLFSSLEFWGWEESRSMLQSTLVRLYWET